MRQKARVPESGSGVYPQKVAVGLPEGRLEPSITDWYGAVVMGGFPKAFGRTERARNRWFDD